MAQQGISFCFTLFPFGQGLGLRLLPIRTFELLGFPAFCEARAFWHFLPQVLNSGVCASPSRWCWADVPQSWINVPPIDDKFQFWTPRLVHPHIGSSMHLKSSSTSLRLPRVDWTKDLVWIWTRPRRYEWLYKNAPDLGRDDILKKGVDLDKTRLTQQTQKSDFPEGAPDWVENDYSWIW